MIRKTLNASRLQEEVSRRLQKLPEVADEGVRISVPRPQLQAPDKKGCNWTMKHFGNASGFTRSIAAVLEAVQAEYNLADELHDTNNENSKQDPFALFDRKPD
ncbi:MAG TPA: hypothetical protein VL424_09355 [Pararobbsia sp.]|nr:hypothetical protein [Pararobbsia sp.]